jgi:hypothetical protein
MTGGRTNFPDPRLREDEVRDQRKRLFRYSITPFRQILVVSIRTPLIFPLIPVSDPDGAI